MPTPGVPVWVADLGHLHALNEPALATDRAGRVVFGNTAAAWRHGTIGEEGWASIDSLLVPEEDHGVLLEIFDQALRGVSWQGQLDVRHVDGSVQPAEVSCPPLSRDDRIVGTLWVSDYAVGEAEQVREIFRQYLRLGCVRKLQEHLEAAGMRSKRRTTVNGRALGDCVLSRGTLYHLLSSPLYLGKVVHRGKVHDGLH